MWVAPLGSRLPPYPCIMDEELTIRARYRGIVAREGRSTAPIHPDDRRSYDDPETSPPPSRPRRRSRKRRASRPAVCPGRFRPRGAPATAQGGRGEAQTATTPTAALPKAQAADSHPAVGEERPRRRLTAEEPAGSRQLRRAGQPRPRRTHPPGGGAAGSSGTAAVPGPTQAEGQSCTAPALFSLLLPLPWLWALPRPRWPPPLVSSLSRVSGCFIRFAALYQLAVCRPKMEPPPDPPPPPEVLGP